MLNKIFPGEIKVQNIVGVKGKWPSILYVGSGPPWGERLTAVELIFTVSHSLLAKHKYFGKYLWNKCWISQQRGTSYRSLPTSDTHIDFRIWV